MEALGSLGIEEDRLYYLPFDEYIRTRPELKGATLDLQEKSYRHYEDKRKKLIEEAINKRKELIRIQKKYKLLYKSSSAAYIMEQGSLMLKEEREKLKFLKNQQITKLKNMIEYEYRIEELKKKSEEKRKLQEKKEEELKKKKEKERKEKEHKQKM